MADKENVQLQQVQAFWKKSMDDALARTTAFYDELAKMETKRNEQATQVVDELAKLTKESFAYASALNAEWRRLSLEAVKRSSEMFTVGG